MENINLPSKHQIDDTVEVYGHNYQVQHVRFTKSKVYYGIGENEVESDFVNSPTEGEGENITPAERLLQP